MGPSLSLLGFEYFSMLFSALSYLNTIPRYPTVVWTHHQRVSWPPSLLVPPSEAPSRKQQEDERKKRGGGENNGVERSGRKAATKKKKKKKKKKRQARTVQSGTFLRVERIYAATYPGWLLNGPLCLLLQASLSFPPRWLYVPTCIYTYIHTRGPPRTPPSPYTARRDRDAKETRAAFKLAATKRINSPGSLDLLIRAAVAFLRGLDRWGPETPRPSCFLAIASAAARPRAECVHACSFQLASTIVVALASSCRRPTLARFFGGGEGCRSALSGIFIIFVVVFIGSSLTKWMKISEERSYLINIRIRLDCLNFPCDK